MKSLTVPSGILSCHKRVVHERPQSNTSLSDPASTNVLGPNLSGRGLGVPVPSKTTLKSVTDGSADRAGRAASGEGRWLPALNAAAPLETPIPTMIESATIQRVVMTPPPLHT